MAQLADRHVLYENSVQDTPEEYRFIDRTFYKLRDRKAFSLREDFCGTAKMCCQWVKGRKQNTAVGIDLDEKVLNWGKRYNLNELNDEQKSRLELINGNVLTANHSPTDIIMAMNFSYFIFKDRHTMKNYFQTCRRALNHGGVLFLDAFGGYDSFRELEEETKYGKFTYVWDQSSYNPITGELKCHIHFKFSDGSALKKAFSYDWRLWTLPEIQEMLADAGFANITIYWEGTDRKTGEGNGVFRPTRNGEADEGWITYISAENLTHA